MEGKCLECGKCCEAIHIPANMDRIKGMCGGDAEFIRNNWEPISADEAYIINPYLLNNKENHATWRMYFYRCKRFDGVTRKCTVHDTRPDVCRNYPWYGNQVNIRPDYIKQVYSPECGYLIDHEKAVKEYEDTKLVDEIKED